MFVAIARKLLGGETAFVNDFHGPQGGEVVVAPALSGQIMHMQLNGQQSLYVQAGSYLASVGEIDTKLKFGGLRTMLGGEGLVLLHCLGQGDLFINSYGGVIPVQVNGNYIVDTGHIVAFTDGLQFNVKSVGGAKSFLFSGEGLVCEFTGQGTVYIQSRNLGSLVGWISKFLVG